MEILIKSIRDLLLVKGLSQGQLSKQLGISPGQLSNTLNGHRKASKNLLDGLSAEYPEMKLIVLAYRDRVYQARRLKREGKSNDNSNGQ
ncbi:MAG: helix-turn-helix transcriptional regulator [Dehalococcoidia bacterium]|jgi:transcriptional regulator with XRE-family HTH domain